MAINFQCAKPSGLLLQGFAASNNFQARRAKLFLMFLETVEVGEWPILWFDRFAIASNVVAARRPLFRGSHLLRLLSLGRRRYEQDGNHN